MTILHALTTFIVVGAVFAATPGLDTAMVLRATTTGGARSGIYAATGITLGAVVWGAGVSVGLGALLAASTLAFTIVKWAGAAYVVWLGLKFMFSPRDTFDATNGGPADAKPVAWLQRGLLTNLLNPKVGIFFISFLPQFVPAGTNFAAFSFLLACIYGAIGLLWYSCLVIATIPLTRFLRRPRVVRVMDRITGIVFVAFGAKLALR